MDTLYLVVSCYNKEVLPITADQLRSKIAALTGSGKIDHNSHIVFVDDGSKDKT